VGGLSFFQRAEVKDVMAYLKLATGNCDSISLLRVINRPPRNIGPKKIEKIRHYAQAKGLGLWDAVEGMVDDSLIVFRHLIADLSLAAGSYSLPDLINFIVKRTGYKQMLEQSQLKKNKKPGDAQSRLENLRELIEVAAAAERRGETVADFIDYMSLASDADAYDENALISLMTLHTAKGLEFPLVFICGLEEGLLPLGHSLEKKEALEEERRLFYVGMTRAKGLLVLTRAQFRLMFRSGHEPRLVESEPSGFLDELHEDSIVDLGAPSLATSD
jgi:DNA helicase II / ATP-dependent DNA helicase PcrA